MYAKVNFGEGHKIVGSIAELGEWRVDQAPTMDWNEGSNWTLDLELPAGSKLEFKVSDILTLGQFRALTTSWLFEQKNFQTYTDLHIRREKKPNCNSTKQAIFT